MAARTVEVDLPAQATLDQGIVALLSSDAGTCPAMRPSTSPPP